MKFPSADRFKFMRGLCFFGIFALVGIQYAVRLRPEIEPEEMRGKTDIEIEALADPLLEDLAKDFYRRMLEEYRASKGFFTCEGECVQKKRRYLLAEKELASVSVIRGRARTSDRVRDRIEDRKEARTPMTFAEELGARKAAIDSRLGERRAERMDIYRHLQAHRHQERRAFLQLSLEERTLVRIEQRDAAVVAYRLDNPQLTPQDVAAARAARIQERMDENTAFRAVNPQLTPQDVAAKRAARIKGRMDAKTAFRRTFPQLTTDGVAEIQAGRLKVRTDATAANQAQVQEHRTEYLNTIAHANGFADWEAMFKWRSLDIVERQETRREARNPGVVELRAAVEGALAPAGAPVSVCRKRKDCYCEDGASDYRGTVSVTRSGKTCQAWHVQEPHTHRWIPENYQGDGLTVNNCRNPDEAATAWCITTDDNTKWEFCDVPKCAVW